MIKGNMPMGIERFVKSFPTFKNFFSSNNITYNPIPMEIYNFLSQPDNIYVMDFFANLDYSPLLGISNILEKKFYNIVDFKKNTRYRQMVGCMICEILYDFGWRKRGQKRLKNCIFSSVSSFEKDINKIKKRILLSAVIEDIK